MAQRTDLYTVLISELVIEEGFNVRYDMGDLQELCDSIVERGVLQPIQAYTKKGDINRYTVIEGHRRVAAIKLGISKGLIDESTFKISMVKTRPMSDVDRSLSLVTFNSGKPLHMLEEAAVYERAIAYKATVQEIAKRTGKSITHINNCLSLLTASVGTKKMIMNGNVSPTTVVGMLKKLEPQDVEKSLKSAITEIKEKRKIPTAEPKSALFEDEDDFSNTKIGSSSEDDDIYRTPDNSKSTGVSGLDLDSDDGEPVKITAKNLKQKEKKNTSYTRSFILNLLTSNGVSCDEQAYVILSENLID